MEADDYVPIAALLITAATSVLAVWQWFAVQKRNAELDVELKTGELRQQNQADVVVEVTGTDGRYNLNTGRLDGGKFLVVRNRGPVPAHNVVATFEKLSDRCRELEKLEAGFPVYDLAPGSQKEISITHRTGGWDAFNTSGFRMTWWWHNPDGSKADPRTQEFP